MLIKENKYFNFNKSLLFNNETIIILSKKKKKKIIFSFNIKKRLIISID